MRTRQPLEPGVRRAAAPRAVLAVVVAALTLAGPVSLAAPATATAAPDDCVGVVVDTGAAEPTTACVPFEEGMTGQEALRRAGYELTFDQNGFICRIDAHPARCASDNTHFWSYYHRAPGAADGQWAFSQQGAADYVVHPGETEGWAYQDGAEATPEPVPYATLREAAAAPTAPASSGSGDAADSDGSDGSDSGGDGPPWALLGVVALIVVLGGLAARQAMARRER